MPRKYIKKEKVHLFTVSPTNPTGWVRPYEGVSASPSAVQSAYLGKQKWGGALVQSIIDTRSAFICGEGISFKIKQGYENADDELAFIEKVMDYNEISGNLSQIAVQTEIDGQLLGTIEPITVLNEELFNIRLYPWNLYNYNVSTDPNDAMNVSKITYKTSSGRSETIESSEFVYKKFGSSLNWVPNEISTRVSSSMTYIESLERAQEDLRQINYIFAHPTPTFKCENQDQCAILMNQLKNLNWTIGTAIITTADFSLTTMNTDAVKSIEAEMQSLMERISAITGIPIYFLGLSRLLNNRSTATMMLEALEAAVKKERSILQNWFNSLIYLILNKSNEVYSTNFDVNCIECSISRPAILDVDNMILDKLFELRQAGVISTETLLRYVPQINDPTLELKRLSEEVL